MRSAVLVPPSTFNTDAGCRCLAYSGGARPLRCNNLLRDAVDRLCRMYGRVGNIPRFVTRHRLALSFQRLKTFLFCKFFPP